MAQEDSSSATQRVLDGERGPDQCPHAAPQHPQRAHRAADPVRLRVTGRRHHRDADHQRADQRERGQETDSSVPWSMSWTSQTRLVGSGTDREDPGWIACPAPIAQRQVALQPRV